MYIHVSVHISYVFHLSILKPYVELIKEDKNSTRVLKIISTQEKNNNDKKNNKVLGF